MADVTPGPNPKYVGKGYNNSNHFFVQHYMTVTAANTDILQCYIPDHTDKDVLPIAVVACSRSVAGVVTYKPVTLTSHQVVPNSGQSAVKTVGMTLVTVGASGLAIGDVVQIEYSATKFTAPSP